MRKFYYRLVQFIGYAILVHHKYNSETFELERKWYHWGVYKYLGIFSHDGSIKMKRIWQIKIRWR